MLQLFDRVIPNQAFTTLAVLGLGLFCAVGLEIIMRTLVAGLLGHSGARYEFEAQDRFFSNLLSRDLSVSDKDQAGEHLDRLETIDKVRNFRSGAAALAMIDIPFALLFFAVLVLVAPWLGLVVALILTAIVLVDRAQQIAVAAIGEKKRLHNQRRYSFVIETLRGVEHVKALRAEQFMERRHERLAGVGAEYSADLSFCQTFGQGVAGGISQATPTIVAIAGSLAVMDQTLTTGALAASIMLSSRIVQPIMRYKSIAGAERGLKKAEGDLNDALVLPPARAPGRDAPGFESMTLRDVCFDAVDGAPVLKDLDLTIRRGEVIAISGPSGSGKSALMWMMAGALRPDGGQALYNGAPIDGFDRDALRRRVALVPQIPTLLAGTVLDNLTRFENERHLPEALALARSLGVERYFAVRPEGLLTEVGGGFSRGLPGSVEMSVPLIGALVGGPDLILFDEANSDLDPETDRKLLAYFESRRGNCTLVLITQRPSYMKLASRTYAIEDFKLKETTGLHPLRLTNPLPWNMFRMGGARAVAT
jgi:ABC-type bacteriocin/lantibiotic exporter with double-glycine peptidase domain